VRVQELLTKFRDYPDEDVFAAKHPQPALLVEPFGEAKGGSVDTPPRGAIHTPSNRPTETGTEVMNALEAARHMARMSEAVHPDARVEWLKKTDRNPFGALITVGRARNNDIVIEHTTVSKLHVIFTQVSGGWHVSDERSANGTFLNGVRLKPAEKRPISDGDSLRLGPDIVARFLEPGSLFSFCAMLKVGKA
jgi:hypothetical protein